MFSHFSPGCRLRNAESLRGKPPFKCLRIFCGGFSLFLPFLGAHHYRTGKNSPFSRKPNVFGNLRALSAKCNLRTRSKLFQNIHLRVAKSHFCLSAHDLRASAYAERVNARDFIKGEPPKVTRREKTRHETQVVCRVVSQLKRFLSSLLKEIARSLNY